MIIEFLNYISTEYFHRQDLEKQKRVANKISEDLKGQVDGIRQYINTSTEDRNNLMKLISEVESIRDENYKVSDGYSGGNWEKLDKMINEIKLSIKANYIVRFELLETRCNQLYNCIEEQNSAISSCVDSYLESNN